jgi:hypothetical protein
MSTPRNKEIWDFHNAPPRTSKLLRRREIQAMQHGGASGSTRVGPARARSKNRIATSELSRFVIRPLFVVLTLFIVVSYRQSPIDDSLGRTRRDC